jgi:hypothetical protein
MRTEEERSSVQSDPRNKANSNPQRIRASFWIIALVVIALALTAVLIRVKG